MGLVANWESLRPRHKARIHLIETSLPHFIINPDSTNPRERRKSETVLYIEERGSGWYDPGKNDFILKESREQGVGVWLAERVSSYY